MTDVFTVGHFRYIASFVNYRANCGIKLINHHLDYHTEPLSAFDCRANHAHDIAHSYRATTRSIAASPATAIVSSTEHIILTSVPTFGPQSATISSRRIRCYRQHSLPQLLPATHNRHRYRQRHEWHDHYRQRFAATAISKPPPLPATPRPLPATLRRHRYQ
jgi:hypothetical protein